MTPSGPGGGASPAARAAAWLVHVYTAAGALAAFAGTVAVVAGDYREAFLWMIAATTVDATDGLLARRARVETVLPGFDGSRLDDIVDYLTFVFLPVLLLYYAALLPGGWPGWLVASTVLLSSAYGFGSLDAKTSDHFFTGFPSYWNIVSLYLYVARLPAVVNAAILLGLCALVFVRIGYVYPSRTPVLARTTVGLGVVWALMVLALVLWLPSTPGWFVGLSLFYPAYYAALSLALQGRRVARVRRAGGA
jgi:phosphatidylcholine synthase